MWERERVMSLAASMTFCKVAITVQEKRTLLDSLTVALSSELKLVFITGHYEIVLILLKA